MAEPVEDFFLRLPLELLEEILLRLPPDEPACLVRASAVRKAWRHILASAVFRDRYRNFHGTPVLGLVQECARFFPTSGLPILPDPSQWSASALKALDCRHGRYIFDDYDQYSAGDTVQLTVLDPLTGHGYRFPTPLNNRQLWYSVAVLCAAQGCDHHGCQGGHFRVVVVSTDHEQRETLGWLYSSETNTWSELATLPHQDIIKYTYIRGSPSVLVGDAIYFDLDRIIEYQLGTLSLSMLERPTDGKGRLMTAEDGRLGFASMVDAPNLTLWSMQTGPEGTMGWVKVRIIDLTLLLLDGVLSITTSDDGISGVAEGTQIIFVSTRLGTYRVDLKSKQARKVSGPARKVFPYTSFYIPAMEAACLDQAQ